jgi:hypothetical protein
MEYPNPGVRIVSFGVQGVFRAHNNWKLRQSVAIPNSHDKSNSIRFLCPFSLVTVAEPDCPVGNPAGTGALAHFLNCIH